VGGRLSLHGLVIVGAKPNGLHSTHSRSSFTLRSLSIVLFCCMPIFPFLPPFLHVFLIIALSLSLFVLHHASLFFLGIALYIKTCLEPHRIRTTNVPSTSLVSFLSSHYSPSFFLSACLTLCPFFGLLLVLVAVGGALSCLVLASCCLVLSRSKLIDRPFPSRSHRLLSILSFLSLFHFFLLSHLSVTHPQANTSG
jgi:hypothetical protein